MRKAKKDGSTAVVYLARGADNGSLSSFKRFVDSYLRFPAGIEHTLFVIFKGFDDADHLQAGREAFARLQYQPIFTDDDSFDIGAFAQALTEIRHDRVCLLNTNSELLTEGWLAKLAANLAQPSVGLVGATASYESLHHFDRRFPQFPNAHVRSNAIMMQRELLSRLLSGYTLREKTDAYFAESGPDGLTRKIFELGLTVMMVARDGRGYPPQWWPYSECFRQGTQRNLLVHDNVTRLYHAAPVSEKKTLSARSWGDFIRNETLLVLPSLTLS